MSKVILDMPIPKTCKDCCLCIPSQEKHTGQFCWKCICRPTIAIKGIEIKPEWCPLKEVPKKMEYDELMDTEEFYIDGYNACIDDILEDS